MVDNCYLGIIKMHKLLLLLKSIFLSPFLVLIKLKLFMASSEIKELVESDVAEMNKRYKENECLMYYLINYPPYRNLFYYRINCRCSFIKLFLRPYPLFNILVENGNIGKNCFVLNHPYGTILHAKKIGDYFTCCHLTTIGNKIHGKNNLLPTIGNNVSLGANVTIIGNISIGDNVIVGAGSVVVNDIPSNSVVAGNPARVIRNI